MEDTGPAMDMLRDLLAQGLRMEETHISWVFLDREHAWKIKKPVDLGFLDFTTLEKRRLACEAEVALNRRLSPEVYLGVAPITLERGVHRLDGNGPPVEWAVKMVRLPAAQRGDRRLEAGTLGLGHLQALAGRLAIFHAAARCDAWTSGFGSPDAVLGNVAENFDQSRKGLAALLGAAKASLLESRLTGYIRDHRLEFERRAAQGRVRDGHGDLRLGQMYFDDKGQAAILDCIEFNDRFRYGDVCADIAFLAMDLAVRDQAILAENFLAAYARASGDYDLYGLADFYMGYRACVRGKIAVFGAFDPGAAEPARKAAAEEAGRHFLFALARLEARTSRPTVVAVGGGIATGKSTLSEALGASLGIPVVSSDVTRKQMAGLDPLERRADRFAEGLYSAEFTERVYAELRRRAGSVSGSGRPVIVDATFRSRRQRAALADLAGRSGHPILFIECRAGEDVVRERLRLRAQGPSVSDGREEIARELQAGWEPDEPGDVPRIVLDTSGPLEASLAKARQAMEAAARPGG